MARRIQITFLAVFLAIAAPAIAQEKFGSIEGTVTDGTGSILPGVTVTVTSPALIGEKTAVSNEAGEYIVRSLGPGIYNVRTDLAGFTPMARPGVEVRVGQTAEVNFRLTMAALTETATVTAEPPVIDVRNTARNYTVNAEAVKKVPISIAQSYTDLWNVAPGVRDTNATNTTGFVLINGANATQNKVKVDGIDASDHVNAGNTTLLNQVIIEEVAVVTGAFEAEAGFGSGGLMNIITRSGGNQFEGGVSGVFTPQEWNDTNLPGTQPADIDTWYPEAHLGGPILRDRLWFFGSAKFLDQSEGTVNVTTHRKEIESTELYGKLTYRPSERHHLIYTYQQDRRTETPSSVNVLLTFDASPLGQFGGYMTGINWDFLVSNRSFLNVLVSYFDKPGSTDGMHGTARRAQYTNAAGALLFFDENYDRDLTNEQTRPYITGSFSHTTTFFGSHDLKAFTEWYPRSSRLTRTRMNEVHVYRDSPVYGPRQLWRVQTPRPAGEVENEAIDEGIAFAIQDSWRPLDRLTVNAGLRYESNHTIVEGRREDLLDWQHVDPRLGLAWQIDDKTVVKTSYSKIGEKFALDFAFGFYPNAIVFDTWESSQVNGVLDVFTEGAPSAATTTRNVERSVPGVNEWVIGLQRQLPGQVAVDVSYVRRRFSHFADTVDRNMILDIPNRRFVGRVDPNFNDLLDVVDSDRVNRTYDSLQLWVNRRLADRWQFNGTYTYAIDKQEGTFGYGTAANAALQFAYGDRASEFFEEERNPRQSLKLAGSYTFPWDITAGIYYSYYSDVILYDQYQQFAPGTPVPRITLSNGRVINDPLFNPVLLVAPPSEEVGREIGGTELLNFQLEKTFNIRGQQFRIAGLLYNAPNSGTRLNYASRDIASPNYNVLSGVQRPRAAQLIVGWEF
jgi:hypothetical protein